MSRQDNREQTSPNACQKKYRCSCCGKDLRSVSSVKASLSSNAFSSAGYKWLEAMSRTKCVLYVDYSVPSILDLGS